MKRFFSEEEIKDICEKYSTGTWSQRLLAEEYHCNHHTIKRVLIENNIPIITHMRKSNLYLKDNYFETIDTEIKAYLLGILFTDGNVFKYKNKEIYQVGLEVSIKDKELLDILKEEVNSSAKITYRKRDNTEMVGIKIYSKKMFEDLNRYGIIPQKTKKNTYFPIDKIPNHLLKHFYRGLIDGDGAIYQSNNKYWHVTFCSYQRKICEKFQEALDALLGNANPAKILKDKNKEIYRIHYNAQDLVKQLVTVLYKDSNIYLTRKYNLARVIFEYKNENDIV